MMNTPKYLLQNVERYPNEPAISIKNNSGKWNTHTWKEFYDKVLSLSKSLLACGIDNNDKISIYSYNRIEWNSCYMAAQMINGVAVGVYHTCSSDEVKWIVGNSDSKIVFVGNNPNDNDEIEKMPNHRLLAVLDELEQVDLVVTMDGVDLLKHEKIITWEDFIQKGEKVDISQIEKRTNSIEPDNTSSLIS